MSTRTEKKDAVGNWLLWVAFWLVLIMFSANQGMQAAAQLEEKHYTVRHDEMLCAVAVNGIRQTMECFREGKAQ